MQNLQLHQERFERTRKDVLGLSEHPSLFETIQIPGGLEQGLFKCRVIYGHEVNTYEFEAYHRKQVQSLKLVHADHVNYAYKYADRSKLDDLFMQRGDADDIIMVKNGHVSDSYYANLLFKTGEQWLTPDTPLLPGIMRQHLLNTGKIEVSSIVPGDLDEFTSVRLINALNTFEEGPEVSTVRIY